MKLLRRAFWLLLLWSARPGWEHQVEAQIVPLSAAPASQLSTNDIQEPPFPVYRPPTEIFRDLLKMTPAQLDQRLANQQPQLRRQLEAKVQEYQAMPPADREARLHATELHDYLQYFIKNPALNRPQQLKSVPDEYRQEVTDRLMQFVILPPALRDEALSRASTADYFMGPGAPVPHAPPPAPQASSPDPIKALSELPDAERAQLFSSIEDFFELDLNDQQKVIGAIPAAQRSHITRVLFQIKSQTKEQRQQTLQVIRTVASMTDQQRQLFFSSAERWKAMSESEQATWLRLVSHIPPPPLPPSVRPGAPLHPLSVATNPGP